MAETTWVHAIEGRVRIKLADVKGRPAKARAIEAQLRRMKGIVGASASPLTGSVVIHYESRRLGHSHIVEALDRLGYRQPMLAAMRDSARTNLTSVRTAVADTVAENVLRFTLELAFQRLLAAL